MEMLGLADWTICDVRTKEFLILKREGSPVHRVLPAFMGYRRGPFDEIADCSRSDHRHGEIGKCYAVGHLTHVHVNRGDSAIAAAEFVLIAAAAMSVEEAQCPEPQ
jgi:hypothetical protein